MRPLRSANHASSGLVPHFAPSQPTQAWLGGDALLSVAGTTPCTLPGPPPPPPPNPFCATFHPIHAPGVYDPSGPLLDNSGVWHTWEDDGSWSHWTSTDLIHWNGSFSDSTNFGGDTGSVSPTPSGVYAFWPIMGGPGAGAIGSAKATSVNLTSWDHRGPTIPMPARINTGYRDPVRAFECVAPLHIHPTPLSSLSVCSVGLQLILFRLACAPRCDVCTRARCFVSSETPQQCATRAQQDSFCFERINGLWT